MEEVDRLAKDVLPGTVKINVPESKKSMAARDAIVRSSFSQSVGVFGLAGLVAHVSIAVVCFNLRTGTDDVAM